jgi:hypothetical protein
MSIAVPCLAIAVAVVVAFLQQGELPSELSKLVKLDELWLNDNGFEGQIPGSVLCELTELTRLGLQSNRFSGPVPSELGTKLRRIIELDLSLNADVEGTCTCILPGRYMYWLKATVCATLIQIAASCSRFSSTKYVFHLHRAHTRVIWTVLAAEQTEVQDDKSRRHYSKQPGELQKAQPPRIEGL